MSTGIVGRPAGSGFARYSAIIRYELLWNIRKKKVVVMVIFALALSILPLALGPLLAGYVGESVTANPDYAVNSIGISFLFLLLAIVTVMNSISGEFESGSIIPLLTKPVSRTEIFFAKLSAAFLTLIPVYLILEVVGIVGGTIVYGPQSHLELVPLSFAGALIGTMVWASIVLAIASVTKSSLIAAFGTLASYIALSIVTPVVGLFMGQSWVLSLLPGAGPSGYIAGAGASNPLVSGLSISAGTDSIGALLIQYALHPSAMVTFYKITGIGAPGTITSVQLYSWSLGTSLAVALLVAAAYFTVFSSIAWYAFRRAQVAE